MTPASECGRAVARHLVELADVIAQAGDAAFRAKRADGVSGSVGAHVRHVLDHVTALLEPAEPGLVDYDTRRRGTLVEHHRPTAIAELRRVAFDLFHLPAADESRPVHLSAVIAANGDRVAATSSVGRELVFVLSHTVHHQAIVALLLASEGRKTPQRFGVAPSTLSAETASCAQSA